MYYTNCIIQIVLYKLYYTFTLSKICKVLTTTNQTKTKQDLITQHTRSAQGAHHAQSPEIACATQKSK